MAFFVRILLPMKVHQIGVKLMAKKMLKKLFPDINLWSFIWIEKEYCYFSSKNIKRLFKDKPIDNNHT